MTIFIGGHWLDYEHPNTSSQQETLKKRAKQLVKKPINMFKCIKNDLNHEKQKLIIYLYRFTN